MSEFAFEDQVVKQMPPRKSSTPITAAERSGAISSSLSANPAVPMTVVPIVARAMFAETSAQISAPTARTAGRRPRTKSREERESISAHRRDREPHGERAQPRRRENERRR